MKAHQLEAEAREFADRLSRMLNTTVCNGPRLSAAALTDGYVRVGLGVSKRELEADPVPVAACDVPGVDLHLILSYTLAPDEQGEHLMVVSSVVGLCLDDDGTRTLFHADYEREKVGYAEAHLQVSAWSDDWAELMAGRSGDRLGKLHFPAGGRRYRTTLEDVVEFLIRERLVTPRAGWEDSLAESRDEFEERQLRAAVRRHPKIAADQLAKLARESS